MTDLATAPVFRSPAQRTARGAGALRRAAALVVAAAAGAVALGALPGPSATAPPDRVALVADAGASPRRR
jgi:hypothetical protein